jgi:hypothetical protein
MNRAATAALCCALLLTACSSSGIGSSAAGSTASPTPQTSHSAGSPGTTPAAVNPSPSPPARNPAATPPVVGLCWPVPTPKTLEGYQNSASAIPCSGRHGLETFAVKQLPARLARTATPTDRSLEGYANAVCVDAAGGNDAALFTGSTYPDYTLVQEQAWLPSAAQWRSGARWVRCDVSIQTDGVRPVTGSLRGRLARPLTPADRFCIRVSGNDEVVVGCDKPHDYEDVGVAPLGGPDAPYPGDAAMRRRAVSACQSAARRYVGVTTQVDTHLLFPARVGWERGGIRQITCEVRLHARRSGTVRNLGSLPA